MTDEHNRQVTLRCRPEGEVREDHFEIQAVPRPRPDDGQVLARTIYLSLDPYMRGRMNAGSSYAEGVELGDVMVGATVGQVVRSRHGDFAEGDFILGHGGWQEYWVEPGQRLRKLDPSAGPLACALGVLGMPGMTAYVGLLDIGRPKEGETVLVSAAAGAVGSVAGQIAKLKGCRVVGTAGSQEKCDYIVNELGFDAAVNYKKGGIAPRLRKACPQGIDVYFDNVGGSVLEAALRLMNVFGRIPLIGLISQYNAADLPAGPNLVWALIKRLTIQGMIVGDHEDRREAFLRDMSEWVAQGRVKQHLDIRQGLETAPRAFLDLFTGQKLGKLVVQVSDDPAA